MHSKLNILTSFIQKLDVIAQHRKYRKPFEKKQEFPCKLASAEGKLLTNDQIIAGLSVKEWRLVNSTNNFTMYTFSNKSIQDHLNYILDQLLMAKNRIELAISIPQLSRQLIKNFASDYVLDYKTEFRKETGEDYDEAFAVNVVPQSSFCVVESTKSPKIAMCYILASKKRTWQIFFHYKKLFDTVNYKKNNLNQILELNECSKAVLIIYSFRLPISLVLGFDIDVGYSHSNPLTPQSKVQVFLRVMPNWTPSIEEAAKKQSKYINLDDYSLKEIPPELFDIKSLLKINLSNNKLTKLPPGFGTIPNLEYLDLSVNRLTSISPNFGYLFTLRVLHLADNDLKVVPKEFGNLTSLETLILRNNLLETLPDEISKLKHLVILNIQGNKFKTLPVCLTKTKLDQRNSNCLVYGNPFIPTVKTLLKNGGIPRLFAAMRESNWEKTIHEEMSKK
ncbi:hypothetical protein HDV06_004187 [Boothiomyces sp. JEL0866]|nr:hypothetical protein HDV06_004187 [Boothiomyces sp. JEL0866]